MNDLDRQYNEVEFGASDSLEDKITGYGRYPITLGAISAIRTLADPSIKSGYNVFGVHNMIPAPFSPKGNIMGGVFFRGLQDKVVDKLSSRFTSFGSLIDDLSNEGLTLGGEKFGLKFTYDSAKSIAGSRAKSGLLPGLNATFSGLANKNTAYEKVIQTFADNGYEESAEKIVNTLRKKVGSKQLIKNIPTTGATDLVKELGDGVLSKTLTNESLEKVGYKATGSFMAKRAVKGFLAGGVGLAAKAIASAPVQIVSAGFELATMANEMIGSARANNIVKHYEERKNFYTNSSIIGSATKLAEASYKNEQELNFLLSTSNLSQQVLNNSNSSKRWQ